MEAFGRVEPICAPSLNPPGDTTAAATAPAATPTRTSPRLQGLQLAPPTMQMIERFEQDDISKGIPRSRSGFAGTQRAQTPRRTRSETEKRRARQQQQRRSPHENDEETKGDDGVAGSPADDDHEADEEVEEEAPTQVADGGDSSADGGDSSAESGGETASSAEDDDEQDWARSAPRLVQVSGQPVLVPPIQEFHDDWAAWEQYKVEYGQRTFQVLSVVETVKVSKRNGKIASQGNSQALVPVELNPYERVYICTHGSPPRRRKKKPGKKRRPMRHINFTGCPFKFRVQLCQNEGKAEKDSDAPWRLRVKMSANWHNHSVGPLVFKTYPQSRGIQDPGNLKRASEMVGDGARPDQVYDMLLDKGENVYKKDVENLVSAHKSRLGRRDDNDGTAELLDEILKDDPDAVITVDETDLMETGVISVTTGHMRQMFARFGELILVDCTHKTNSYHYQLCTIMVMDEYGLGQVVQQSLMETNTDWHMERVLAHLKRANPTSFKLVRVVMVDKDLNEIKVIQREFEEARVLICHFHVLAYLEKVKHKPEYGKISAHDHVALECHVKNVVYAETRDAYESTKATLIATCERLDFRSFAEYLDRNWFDCDEMWALYRRNKLPHLKNHTNNRLECWFGKFKRGVDDSTIMRDCIEALLKNSRRCKNEYEKLHVREGRWFNENYDDEMAGVLLCSTPFVAKAIDPQYTAARNKAERYTFEDRDEDHLVTVHGKASENTIDLLDFSCSCKFVLNMRLPCRHAMAYRIFKKISPVIPLKRIDVRWKRQVMMPPTVSPFMLREATSTKTSAKTNADLTRDRNRRYNEALRLLQPICSEIADIADEDEFQAYVEFLQAQFRNVRKRKRLAAETDGEGEGGSHEPRRARTTSSDFVGDTIDSPPVELSQANSLYSPDVGEVPPPALDQVRVPLLRDLVVDIADEKIGEEVGDGHMAADEEMKENPGPNSVETVQYLEMKENPGPNSVETVQYLEETGQDLDVSEVEDTVEGSSVRINLNRNAPKTGRPKTSRAAIVAEKRQEQVRFNAAEDAKRVLGELTMGEVLNSLEREQPGLEVAGRRLAGIHVRFHKYENSRPKYLKIPNPSLNRDVYYVLPTKLLEGCFKVLPLATRDGEAIQVGTPDAQAPTRRSPRNVQEVVSIAGVGMYSRAQIEDMRRAATIRKLVEDGRKFVAWMRHEVAPRAPAGLQPTCVELADEVERLYPNAYIPGLPELNDYVVSSLYLLTPPSWFNGGLISAFCERLQALYPGVKYAGIFTMNRPTTRSKTKLPNTQERNRLLGFAADDAATHVFMAVNFGDDHWTGVMVCKMSQEIKCYDSIPMPLRERPLRELSASLTGEQDPIFPNYTIVAINSPIQVDGFSCGLLVCIKFWCEVDKTVPRNVDDFALTKHRVDVLHFVLRGRKRQ